MKKLCYIIIVNYKKWDESLECIRSVFQSEDTGFKVIVVDNCSGNRSLESIRDALATAPVGKRHSDQPAVPLLLDLTSFTLAGPSSLPDLTLVQNDRNGGFAAGNNAVIRALLGEDARIWLLNPDMTVQPGTLTAMTGCLQQNEKAVVGVVHRDFYHPDAVLFYGGGKINYWSGNISLVRDSRQTAGLDYISGGSLLTETGSFRTVGLLPEDYFLYWEETDWCFRARQKGFSMTACLQAVCYDKGGTTIGRGFLADYFYTRNGLFFLRKYKKGYLPMAFLLVFFRAGKKLLLGQPARARGVLTGAYDFLTGKRYENK